MVVAEHHESGEPSSDSGATARVQAARPEARHGGGVLRPDRVHQRPPAVDLQQHPGVASQVTASPAGSAGVRSGASGTVAGAPPAERRPTSMFRIIRAEALARGSPGSVLANSPSTAFGEAEAIRRSSPGRAPMFRRTCSPSAARAPVRASGTDRTAAVGRRLLRDTITRLRTPRARFPPTVTIVTDGHGGDQG